MDRSRATRAPTSPGEILREEFLVPLEMTQRQLAEHIGQDVKVINRIVNGRAAVTAEVALKLGAAFRTSPEFWLNAQKAVDLHAARSHIRKLPKPLVSKVRQGRTSSLREAPAKKRRPPPRRGKGEDAARAATVGKKSSTASA